MSQTRKLAAIMFTDIQGYTALMQSDEAEAIKLRKRHREVFENHHETYNGTILQYYGDGTLSIFDSALDAAKCAIEIQRELIHGDPYIPLRIGLHTGDIIYSETEAIGDGVNVSSRVESIAEPGSIMISDKFYDYVKNQKEISIASMGIFEFKNVKKPMEVFALEAEGLVVPNPKQLQGKFKKKYGQTWWKKAVERKVPQIAGSYLALVALIGFISSFLVQSLDYPSHFSSLTWVFLLSLLPSVLVYAYHHGKTAQGPWTLTEKVTIPTNLAMAGILLFAFFTNQGMRAATEVVDVELEDGTIIKKTIVKSDHQKKLYVASFTNKSDTSLYDWIGTGIPFGLEMEWDQDPYIMNVFEEEKVISQFSEQLEAAEEQNLPMMLTGDFRIADSGYYVNPKLYDTKTGQLIKDWDFYGTDLLALLDEISLKIKRDLNIPEEHIQQVRDLSVPHQLTDSLDAYKHFCDAMRVLGTRQFGQSLAYLDEAVKVDSTFAMANYYIGTFNHQLSLSEKKAEKATKLAMDYRTRLSEAMQTNIQILNYKIQGKDEKVARLGKMMTEMRPNSPDLQLNLAVQYRLMDRYEEALEAVKKYQELSSDLTVNVTLEMYLLNRLGRTKEGLKIGKKLLKESPENLAYIKEVARLHLSEKNYDEAEALYERASFLDPENNVWESFLTHTQFMKDSADLYTKEIRDSYLGAYRIELRDALINIVGNETTLFMKLKNQPRAELYPMSKNNFVVEFTGGIMKFPLNPSGEVDRLLLSEGGSQFFNCFKQTDDIQQALSLIADKKYEEAEKAITPLIDTYPSHYYLPTLVKHASYMLNNNPISEDAWKAYVGKYTVQTLNADIIIQKGLPYIQFPATSATMDLTPLYPIGEEEFMLLSGYQNTFKFKRKGRKIAGLDVLSRGKVALSMDKEK